MRKPRARPRGFLRINNVQDPALIEALYKASQAGVEIRLNVRGVCCLRPGVPGLSEGIRVISIVDRFLEHSRILYVHNGGSPRLFISSADWMTRNLDKRIELLVPIDDKAAKARLISILKIAFKDTTNAWELKPDGSYTRLKADSKKEIMRSQEFFYREARRRAPRRGPAGAYLPRAGERRQPLHQLPHERRQLAAADSPAGSHVPSSHAGTDGALRRAECVYDLSRREDAGVGGRTDGGVVG